LKAGLKPDSQRYFDYHAANDKFDAINKRELELGGHDGFFDVFDGSKRYCEIVSKNCLNSHKKTTSVMLVVFHFVIAVNVVRRL
jgi:hypothetical protein